MGLSYLGNFWNSLGEFLVFRLLAFPEKEYSVFFAYVFKANLKQGFDLLRFVRDFDCELVIA
jgi:hypothetical protein